jgi:hypothetical protein
MYYKLMLKKIAFCLAACSIVLHSPAYGSWFFKSTDAEQLQEALQSDDPETVEDCLNRQIELRHYIGVLRLKQHALRMMQAERGRINGKPGATAQDLAAAMRPWQKIIALADGSKKNIRRQGLPNQTQQ